MILPVADYITLYVQDGQPAEVVATRYAGDGDFCDGPGRQHHPSPPDAAKVIEEINRRYKWAVTLAPWSLTERGWVAQVTSCLTARRSA